MAETLGQVTVVTSTDFPKTLQAGHRILISVVPSDGDVDSAHQVIVAADVIGSGSEQSMLLPMIEKTAPYREAHTLITADAADCQTCTLRSQCLKKPGSLRGRQVTHFEPKVRNPSNPSERMKRAIDSERGRRLYSQRIGTGEPVFGNLRHNKRLTRLNLRGREKVNAQWHLYCMVHNIEKLANSGWAP